MYDFHSIHIYVQLSAVFNNHYRLIYYMSLVNKIIIYVGRIILK